jgi:hypothetical protein
MKWNEVNNMAVAENESGSFPTYFFIYVISMLIIPVGYMMYLIYKATTRKNWRFLSGFLKYVMIAGVSFLFLYAHEINTSIGH